MGDKSTEADAVLEAMENGDAHDRLLGYMEGGETAEDAIERLTDALPSFAARECTQCGTKLDPLDDSSWIAWRELVEDTDRRRTDLYCGLGCLTDSLNAKVEVPITETAEESDFV